jgi:acyl-CoA reductase-like NAD-dependent aldehyde dehydrogenase
MRSQDLVVLLTPVKDSFTDVVDTGEEFFSGVTLVKHTKTAKVSLTGVVDTGEKILTSVNMPPMYEEAFRE